MHHSTYQTRLEDERRSKTRVSVFVSCLEVHSHSILSILFLNPVVVFLSHSLDAVDPNANDAFKASRNLGDVIDRVLRNQQEASNGSGPRKLLTVEASLMTPVQPMLVSIAAEVCKTRTRTLTLQRFSLIYQFREIVEEMRCK